MRLTGDFQILQRAENGYAHVIFDGSYDGDGSVAARVYREDDGVHVIYWTPCKRDGACGSWQ